MSANNKTRGSAQGVSMDNLSQVTPSDAVPEESRAENNEEQPKSTRISISKLDPEALAELKGFTLWLNQVGGRDGLLTIGDVVSAALKGEGSLPEWRQKYNNGNPFPQAVSVPPGRK